MLYLNHSDRERYNRVRLWWFVSTGTDRDGGGRCLFCFSVIAGSIARGIFH